METESTFPHDVITLGCTDGDDTAATLTYTMTSGDTTMLQVASIYFFVDHHQFFVLVKAAIDIHKKVGLSGGLVR